MRGSTRRRERVLVPTRYRVPEHEEATDEIPVDYSGTDVEIGFNVTYLMDALKALKNEQVEAELQDANTGCMLHDPDNDDTLYLIMPMRL